MSLRVAQREECGHYTRRPRESVNLHAGPHGQQWLWKEDNIFYLYSNPLASSCKSLKAWPTSGFGRRPTRSLRGVLAGPLNDMDATTTAGPRSLAAARPTKN